MAPVQLHLKASDEDDNTKVEPDDEDTEDPSVKKEPEEDAACGVSGVRKVRFALAGLGPRDSCTQALRMHPPNKSMLSE